ncbi:UNVERIFIED_CONTAM: hypothetical protein PYX00_009722 [Menopon gallinae]|uniref:DNA replication complex GINS protein PSF1 n=1 Tax=Menopon gallinae TaxID=328185 RepID=A0AAW2HCW5_9NEOP
MFAEKAFELIKDLHRSQDNLPLFNDEGVRQVLEEIQFIFDENQRDALVEGHRDEGFTSTISFRHMAFERNKRCLIAYLYNRLRRIRQIRWEFGSILPAEVRANLGNSEFVWFTKYCKCLATYMETIGREPD